MGRRRAAPGSDLWRGSGVTRLTLLNPERTAGNHKNKRQPHIPDAVHGHGLEMAAQPKPVPIPALTGGEGNGVESLG